MHVKVELDLHDQAAPILTHSFLSVQLHCHMSKLV